MNRRKLLLVGLIALLAVLLVAGVASASLKITAVLNAWDDKLNRYENGNLTMYLNTDPEPFWVELGFDNVIHPVPACGTTNGTVWAGDAEIGLYHTDTTPPAPNGAPGFQSSQNWALVPCSTFLTNKYPPAGDIIASCVPNDPNVNNACEVVTQDVVTGCTTGNCLNEIVTTFDLVMDLDCDGVIDPQFAPPGGLCMYWEGVKPTFPSPNGVWNGNIQVRVKSVGDGDKTINFNDLRGPNAVGLREFSAAANEAIPGGLGVLAGGIVLGLFGIGLAWRKARG